MKRLLASLVIGVAWVVHGQCPLEQEVQRIQTKYAALWSATNQPVRTAYQKALRKTELTPDYMALEAKWQKTVREAVVRRNPEFKVYTKFLEEVDSNKAVARQQGAAALVAFQDRTLRELETRQKEREAFRKEAELVINEPMVKRAQNEMRQKFESVLLQEKPEVRWYDQMLHRYQNEISVLRQAQLQIPMPVKETR